ncbi:MAG: ABC transporter substrate-binding protein, partial [Rhodospirillaceae bacterium]
MTSSPLDTGTDQTMTTALARRSFLSGLGALAAAAVAAPAFAADPAAKAQGPERLKVMLDWFVNPDHAPITVAQQKGFFRDAGLAVELIAPADPNAPPKLVAAKEADIALTYQPQLHLLAEGGLPIVRIGTLIETPLNSLVVLKNGPVKEIADLKGRKVGYSISGFEDALLGTMLQSHGLQLSDVTLINV